MTFKTLLFAACAFLLTTVAAISATNPDLARTVSVDFSVVGWGESFPELGYMDGGKIKPLRVPIFARSTSVHYVGDSALKLFLKQEKEGKQVEIMVAAPEINPDDKHILILIAPPVAGKSPVKVLRFPTNEKFTGGLLRVFNLTPVPMAIKGPAAAAVLAPDASHTFQPVDGGLTFITAYQEGGAWRRLHELRLPIPADMETTLIYFKTDLEMFKSRGGIEDPIQSITLQELKPAPDKVTPSVSLAGR